MTYTEEDMERLRPQWRELFGEEMPYGFEIGPEQYLVMRACIQQCSQAPLEAYVDSLPKGVLY